MRPQTSYVTITPWAALTLVLLAFCGQSEKRETCFVALEIGAGEIVRENEKSCAKALPPASTFKIPGALIALESGTVNARERIEWDGFEHSFPEWNRDHSMQSAIRFSVPWFFQQAASRLDPERTQRFLNDFAYGSGDIARNPSMFWLTGEYRITPADQLVFLSRFFQDQLPGVSKRNQRTVRGFLLQESGTISNAGGVHTFEIVPDARLHAKTGFLALPDGFRTSWLVGQIEKNERRIVFVSSISGSDKSISGLSGARAARERLAQLLEESAPETKDAPENPSAP